MQRVLIPRIYQFSTFWMNLGLSADQLIA